MRDAACTSLLFSARELSNGFDETPNFATHCPFKGEASYWVKGEASYWALVLCNREIENVMWPYEIPYDEKPELAGFGAFVWDRSDQWFEEDEEIFVHPRDPYKRIDTVPSSRLVRVVIGGEIVAESTRAKFLFETSMPARYYIPKDDVRMTLLRQTDSQTRCPYKGIASYWSTVIGEERFENIAWSYADPVPECPRIKDLICFYNERVEAIHVDGLEV